MSELFESHNSLDDGADFLGPGRSMDPDRVPPRWLGSFPANLLCGGLSPAKSLASNVFFGFALWWIFGFVFGFALWSLLIATPESTGEIRNHGIAFRALRTLGPQDVAQLEGA